MLECMCGGHGGLASYQAEKHCICELQCIGTTGLIRRCNGYAARMGVHGLLSVLELIWAERFTNNMATFVF